MISRPPPRPEGFEAWQARPRLRPLRFSARPRSESRVKADLLSKKAVDYAILCTAKRTMIQWTFQRASCSMFQARVPQLLNHEQSVANSVGPTLVNATRCDKANASQGLTAYIRTVCHGQNISLIAAFAIREGALYGAYLTHLVIVYL